jgi:hypothetical protein
MAVERSFPGEQIQFFPRRSSLVFGSPAAATGVGKKSKSHAGWDMARPAHGHPHPRPPMSSTQRLQAPRKYLDTREQADGKSGIRLCSFGKLTSVVVDDTQRS